MSLIATYCATKVPAKHDSQLRIEYEVRGNTITIYECRPPWRQELGPDGLHFRVGSDDSSLDALRTRPERPSAGAPLPRARARPGAPDPRPGQRSHRHFLGLASPGPTSSTPCWASPRTGGDALESWNVRHDPRRGPSRKGHRRQAGNGPRHSGPTSGGYLALHGRTRSRPRPADRYSGVQRRDPGGTGLGLAPDWPCTWSSHFDHRNRQYPQRNTRRTGWPGSRRTRCRWRVARFQTEPRDIGRYRRAGAAIHC